MERFIDPSDFNIQTAKLRGADIFLQYFITILAIPRQIGFFIDITWAVL